jgi:hypothetical protein
MKVQGLTLLLYCLIGMLPRQCPAQEHTTGQEVFHPYHKVALVLSQAQVFEGRNADGKRKLLSLPSWGLDYNYFFQPKWAIGLHTDFIIEKFEVEKHLESGGDEETIERSYPIAPAIMGIFKPGPRCNILLGMGAEFAKEANFALTRCGAEYSGELPKGWKYLGP